MQTSRTRLEKEADAIRLSNRANDSLRFTYGCDENAVYGLVQANRDAFLARGILGSIGYRDSKRTARLWASLDRTRRALDAADRRVAACLRDRSR